ncbi:MAG: Do family serine endopeptidase [Hyphomicrobiales bacterium]|jgi:serine protease Do|nr:Do family serine endopeptidase [Hyphomicrobiales bacterium]
MNKYFQISIYVLVIFITNSSLSLGNNYADFSEIAEIYADSVVNISSKQKIENANPFNGIDPEEVPDVFKEYYEKNKNPQQQEKYSSLGSGFIIDNKGIIVTNAHVIQDADEIEVTFSNGIILSAEIIGKDPKTDIAVLKVIPQPDQKLLALEFGDSDKLRVGEWVVAIGNPFGLGGTVTAGIVSAKNRDIRAGPYDNFIQTDAAINKGNSGGPLFNTNGQVVGINSAIISTTGGSVGIGFAIPSKTAISIVEQLLEFGETKRGWLGVRIQDVTEDIASSLGLDEPKGALVVAVDEKSPARNAGIKSGDVIIEFNNIPVNVMRKLPRIVAETKVGSKVEVKIWRNNRSINKYVVVERLNEVLLINNDIEDEDGNDIIEDSFVLNLGFSLNKINKELSDAYNFNVNQKGLVVTKINNESDSYKRGLREGDVVNVINEPELYSKNQFMRIIEKYRNANRNLMLIKVVRGKNMIKVFPIDISLD